MTGTLAALERLPVRHRHCCCRTRHRYRAKRSCFRPRCQPAKPVPPPSKKGFPEFSPAERWTVGDKRSKLRAEPLLEQSRLNALMGHRAVERRMLQQSESVNARLAALNRKAQSLRELFSNLAREKRDEDAAQTGKGIAQHNRQTRNNRLDRRARSPTAAKARGSMNSGSRAGGRNALAKTREQGVLQRARPSGTRYRAGRCAV